MQRTKYFSPTLREVPAEATAESHKLMLRAGLVRMLASGIYSYLPLGWSAVRKAMEIVREEMNKIGGQEFLFPALTPAEIWKETGRLNDFGEIMFRFKDRKGQLECLAPTHEEIICATARGEIRSWRDLPQTWYQIQTKFRDEPRPRGGLLRLRQFIMKDSYSLDEDNEGLAESYERHRIAYERIFQRCGIEYFIVGASSGVMGGALSQEFMFESDSGEDQVVRCDDCGYASNIEVAASKNIEVSMGKPEGLREVSTPTQRTVDEVSDFLSIPKNRMVKTLVYSTSLGSIIALVAGDDELSEDKLMKLCEGNVIPATPEEVKKFMGAEIGFLGPHGDHGLKVFADSRLEKSSGMVTGANKNQFHVMGLDLTRDVKNVEFKDLRVVKDDENCLKCGSKLRIVRAIEIGHIFQLGTKYSKAMHTNFLDEKGNEKPIVMGSYGIGIERILAAVVESKSDKDGIRWNSALTPIDVVLIPFGDDGEVLTQAEDLYQSLVASGLEVMIDDRNVRPGVKMKDADLLGFPAQVIISSRNIKKELVEIKDRWTGERTFVKSAEIETEIRRILDSRLPRISQDNL